MDLEDREAPLWTKSFVAVWFSNFFLFISYQMLMPVFPIYVMSMGGDQTVVGLAVTIFTISALMIRPVAGRYLDFYGRRKVLTIGLIIFVFSAVSYFWMVAIALIFIIRAFHGIGWGIVTTANGAIVSDIVSPAKRGEGMGYYGLSQNLSLAIGPAVGIYVMYTWDFQILFLVSVTLAICSLLLSQMIRLQPSTKSSVLPEMKVSLFSTKGLIEKSALLPAVLMTFMAFTYGGVINFIALFGQEAGIENIGVFFVTTAVILMITRTFSGKLYDRKGHPWVLIPGAVFVGAGLLILSFSNSMVSLIASSFCYGLGYGMIHPGLHAWIVTATPSHRRGAANSTFYSAIDVGIGGGALISGALAKLIGYALMYRLLVIWVLLFFLIYFIQLRRERAVGQEKGISAEH
ncbi:MULTISPECIES: MFS transporter [unclassified Paenibacillus]|uniref:MFS transporter n=1 Tax=unclassified Paenibacillus TaxID=185978 RepID=UPI001AE14E20|nr:MULTISPECIES: MFS transporter [unclassified Paenibacillus]MBP1157168.1 MFS family permease [Paenibacillus sp. PvP091]MBP1172093.1 MFS family permease [Paenibacillus sp. PvR098]MBP2438474.1 MFS family permease [Paenibacillus sp. PvP052]